MIYSLILKAGLNTATEYKKMASFFL